jgi:hypothetical protein
MHPKKMMTSRCLLSFYFLNFYSPKVDNDKPSLSLVRHCFFSLLKM